MAPLGASYKVFFFLMDLFWEKFSDGFIFGERHFWELLRVFVGFEAVFFVVFLGLSPGFSSFFYGLLFLSDGFLRFLWVLLGFS